MKLIEDAVWNFCVGISACPSRGKRLVIFGNNGNGKSRSCRAIRRFIQDRAIDLPLVLTPDGDMALISCCLINWAQKVDEFKRTQQWDIEDLVDSTVLMIDDIGAEHDPSKIGLERLYLILERREFKWTIITTNKQPDSWEHSFERRIADRLFRNADHVDLSKLPSFAVNGEK